jgi:hypothetical protein
MRTVMEISRLLDVLLSADDFPQRAIPALMGETKLRCRSHSSNPQLFAIAAPIVMLSGQIDAAR